MARTEVVVDTLDGPCRTTLHTPPTGGPRPGVLCYPDAGGVRETFAAMADRLAALGFAVLLPDIYHRTPYAPFDTTTLFGDPEEFARLTALTRTLTPEMVVADAGALLAALAARPEVADGGLGVVGYCFGGAMALRAAAHHPARVAAAMTVHGGGLAADDDPASPHHVVDRIRAAVHVAAATDDPAFDDEQHRRLRAAFDVAGVRATIETVPAAHGFAVPDNPTHDDAADLRHRETLAAFLGEHLGA
ncbi:dienelactone hydrolase family protein [Actinomycetospora straminea]|uniref:Dienelactone hydrolase family protein n=1 Tax=Actinomycetospora straminea TaxID=663607 RepID=A0ABP9F4H5_9PSEU|nr:alpha/beta fold hydrolase [Actinomycetospora straminea]MDD7933022.1 alpha/beta fold hydrolase [Actinomycetospora straminea]